MSIAAAYARAAHAAGVQRLVASYRSIPENATVRLAKPTSNLFRARAKNTVSGLDTSGLTAVIAVDPDARTADVAGMCTYEDLVAATLPDGLAPLVVPQLKTITLGGAVTGLGIESTSFRNGLPLEAGFRHWKANDLYALSVVLRRPIRRMEIALRQCVQPGTRPG